MFQPPVSLDSLAQNLPGAFAALEGQFKDAGFKSMLTSQLSNPNAVEMFESMIHDPSAVNSISSMLNDPAVKSSLWEQFATQYPNAIESSSHSASGDSRSSVSAEATGEYEFSESKSRIEHGRSTMDLESLDRSHSGVSGRPGLVVTGWVIVILLSALAPTY
ncbi:hypothetical protein FBU59_000695 [Linderina macrospora]|uniref:Uncharacterized protein n=1 Tax=Linderina macrospora TaxID=4868 RepID=A0ACC1JFX1_9FUNG|nr:hypothetical protein FBU59_000695 [Linderina macrospora]